MKIDDMPWFEKPDVRISKEGVDKLTDVELLAMIIGKGTNEGVLDLSNRLIKKYNLNRLEDLGVEELTKECNDKVTALRILSFIELSKRYNKLVKGGYNTKVINSAKDVYNMFVDEYRNYKKEVLSVVLLDTKLRVIKVKEVSVGILNSSLSHPREIFKEAIKESAYAIILVHNHPSGDCTPSESDLTTTTNLIKVGNYLDIKLLDHVVIGRNGYWSFRENK
ncbi:DNA repair protein RadC [Candidatus Woesearchaeota archaeon]|nr:DNA repair protein RadC [Candidatus Woesearchaeota archaeon]